MLKRIFDITLSFFGLIFLCPIFLVIGILIKINSVGPVIFKQTRVGRFERKFLIYKFRTMHVNSEEQNKITRANDPRVTYI